MVRRWRDGAGPVSAALLLLLSTGGCGRYGERLRQRELVVHFDPAATPEQHRAALAACSGIPNASPEPIGPGTLKSSRLNDVRFRIDNATSREVARLTACLNRQPGVRGFDIPEPM